MPRLCVQLAARLCQGCQREFILIASAFRCRSRCEPGPRGIQAASERLQQAAEGLHSNDTTQRQPHIHAHAYRALSFDKLLLALNEKS